jgi:hydrogenase maturation protease
MTILKARCLILACGNTLRGDDGIGPWLAQWAENRFQSESAVRVQSRQQWTPELSEEIAQANSVLFIDCSIASDPGSVLLVPVAPAEVDPGIATHHMGAPQLLSLSKEFYDSLPHCAQLLTVGAASTELGESFSDPVAAAIPTACKMIEEIVLRALQERT